MPSRRPSNSPSSSSISLSSRENNKNSKNAALKVGRQSASSNSSSSSSTSASVGKPIDSTRAKILALQRAREQRRAAAKNYKKERAAEEARNLKAGKPGDVDFQRLIKKFRRTQLNDPLPYSTPKTDGENCRINICARVRPVNEKEKRQKSFAAVTASNPAMYVHECKFKVDGITKHLINHTFEFDNTFGENSDNESVYAVTARPLVEFVFKKNTTQRKRRGLGGNATCFAYGQTGSGKTYTMSALQQEAAQDMLDMLELQEFKHLKLHVSFFEIYGGRVSDLLHEDSDLLHIREDGKGVVHVRGLQSKEADSVEKVLSLIAHGVSKRKTEATAVHDKSSRSHAICNLELRFIDSGKEYGKLSLIDLAGSERASETISDKEKQRRMEGADINTSLLALKECIRALDKGLTHVPYRQSKLTLVLKEAFFPGARTTMISTIAPTQSDQNHTLNTLRYSNRIKSKGGNKAGKSTASYTNEDTQWGRKSPLSTSDANKPTTTISPTVGGPKQGKKKSGSKQRRSGGRMATGKGTKCSGIVRAPEPKSSTSIPAPQSRPELRTKLAGKSRLGKPKIHLKKEGVISPPPPPTHRMSSFSKVSEMGRECEDTTRTFEEMLASMRQEKHKGGDGVLGVSGESVKGAFEEGVGGSESLLEGINMIPEKIDAVIDVERTKQKILDLKSDSKYSKEEKKGKRSQEELQSVVDMLLEKEENLMNSHMANIQENAALLTEEGALLAKVQGQDVVDYDIDEYTIRLEEILTRKVDMCERLLSTLRDFRETLSKEESLASM
eukprot:g6288.t1